MIGTELVAKAPADGYTLGFLDTAFAINPAIAPSLPYDAEKDFAIMNIVGMSPTVLVVHSSVPAKTLKELIAYAHVQAGTLRALAITGSKPSPVLPNVPTFASLGLPSVNPGSFRFLAGQAAMPPAVQQRLVAGMEKLAHIPSLATRMGELGYEPAFIGPPGSRDYVFAEMRKWRKVMQDSAMKVN